MQRHNAQSKMSSFLQKRAYCLVIQYQMVICENICLKVTLQRLRSLYLHIFECSHARKDTHAHRLTHTVKKRGCNFEKYKTANITGV